MPSSTDKVGRKFVSNRPEVAFTAKEDCIVQVWFSPRTAKGEEASQVFFELEQGPCSLAEGVPLPIGVTVDVRLSVGESIWVVTQDEALVGWSVRRWLDAEEK
jgi:hypothetical protein